MKIRLTLFLLLLCSTTAMAQAVLMPLQQEVRQAEDANFRVASNLQLTPLLLPFFDDFAAATVTPDPERWINGGVYVNNRFAVEPVTRNVASFDGLNAQGVPYNVNAVAPGPADTLTSQPILLGGLTPADSVYLSFYWQSGGLGDVPDRAANNTVYLQLEFKDVTGAWQQVWRQQSVGEVTPFAQVFVGLREQRYFHDGFQFRFRSVGQQSGMMDVWNLDYVELDRNRRRGQNTTRDIGISKGVSRLLKHYTAMPLRQFVENPTSELNEEVQATLNNLGGIPGAISWRGFIKVDGTATADTFLVTQGLVPAQARQYNIQGVPRIDNLPLPDENFTLLHGFLLDTKEQDPLQRANDSTYRRTEFADYFAYDDGTAEASFSYPATGTAQVAQRFDLSRPDQVRGFRVYFPRIRNGLAGTTLAFRVWAENEGVPGEVLYQEAFQVQYTDDRNSFYEVVFAKPVNVNGSFYIGWQQPGNLFINIGFDRNEPATGRRFLWSTLNGWQEDTIVEGAVMMRPLMTGSVLSAGRGVIPDNLKVYPNPSSGQFFIEGEYKALRVFNIAGREIYSQPYRGTQTPVNLTGFANGIYTIRIETNKTIITKKLILTTP